MHLRNISIRRRLFACFLLIIILVFSLSAMMVHDLKSIGVEIENMYNHPLVVSNAVRDIRSNMLDIHVALDDLILSSDPLERKHNIATIEEREKRIMNLFDLVERQFLGDRREVFSAKRRFVRWKSGRDDIISFVKQGDNTRAADIMQNIEDKHIEALDEQMQNLIDFASRKAEEFLKNSRVKSNDLLWIFYLAMLGTTLVSLVVVFFMVNSITRPIDKILGHIQQIARGDLSRHIKYTSRDELAVLSKNINIMLESLSELEDKARAIGLGDFTVEIVPRSDGDTLALAMRNMVEQLANAARIAGKVADGDFSEQLIVNHEKNLLARSINSMLVSLKEAQIAHREADWEKNGLAELDREMRGERDVMPLAGKVITFLCTYTGALVGALYVLNDKQSMLQLKGSYAFEKRKAMNSEIGLGEGLVGEVAVQKKMVSLTSVPDDYTRIGSALGESLPHNILIVPLLHEDVCKGVVELGSLDEFSDTVLGFFHAAADNIAVAITASQHQDRLEELLATARQQTEELKVREEELKATNEELEVQAASLKESQEQLELQQDKLESTNVDLESKTEELAGQKQEIERRNEELVTAREELEERAADLAMASRYKSEFLANMSHELRTPLNSLLILAQTLADNREENLTPGQKQAASVIFESGKDLLDLINEILDLSKIEAGRVEADMAEVSVSEMAENISTIFAHMAKEKGLDFHVDVEQNLSDTIITDRKRLEQILKNFIGNSMKFTAEGEVRLTISRACPESMQDDDGAIPENAISFSVSDTGIGIPEDKQRAVFEAFQQADGSTARQYGGTGLGLSISRELAVLLGGAIGLESEPGKGSTFTLCLPVVPETEAAASDTSVPVPEPEPESLPAPATPPSRAEAVEKIPDDCEDLAPDDNVMLIIEDDPQFAAILMSQCHDRNFKALACATGEEGLELARKHIPSGIILDIRLPGMNGWEVLTALKNDTVTRHIPVHMMSAEHADNEALRRGAIGFLTKPVDHAQLNMAFDRFSSAINKEIKELLIVEDNETLRGVIMDLIGNGDVTSVAATTGGEAYDLLQSRTFDCMILDLGLPDMSGLDLLYRLRDHAVTVPPVIIYTGRDLSRDEEKELMKYADSIVIKDARSRERLLDEASLFLHRVIDKMPDEKQKIIENLYNRDVIFQDRTVLLVDDDMRNVFALSGALEAKGIEVEVAENGRQALEMLDANPDIDIVLMDIMMPVMDGFEAMGKIREQQRFRKLPIIALTAKAMKDDRQKCINSGASDYITKPVDIERLFSMMRVWLYR